MDGRLCTLFEEIVSDLTGYLSQLRIDVIFLFFLFF
jgi:hypothetical protein